MAVLGAALIALATVGLGGLFRLLTLLGLNVGTGLDAVAGLIIIVMVVVGLCLLIAGLVLALARAHARWLIGSGLALLCLGSGPLFVIIVAAKLGLTRDPNPNPVLEGMLAGFTFIPATVLLICGLVALARGHYRAA
jgi:hypothetical protein